MNLKHQTYKTTLAWAGLLAFMTLFRPNSLPVVVLIVPFILMYLALFSLWRLAGMLRSRYFLRSSVWSPHPRLGMAVCGSFVLLVVLQSLGQLTIRDVVTVTAIVCLGYLYMARSRFVLAKH